MQSSKKIKSYLSLSYKSILLVMMALLVASCSQNTEEAPINPKPQNKISIHGFFPFDKEIDLRMILQYTTSNPSCDRVERAFGLFEAYRGPRGKQIELNIAKDNKTYRADFYTDQIMAGECGWKLDAVNYRTVWIKKPLYLNKIAEKDNGFNSSIGFGFDEKANMVAVQMPDFECSFYSNEYSATPEDVATEMGTKTPRCGLKNSAAHFPALSLKQNDFEINFDFDPVLRFYEGDMNFYVSKGITPQMYWAKLRESQRKEADQQKTNTTK